MQDFEPFEKSDKGFNLKDVASKSGLTKPLTVENQAMFSFDQDKDGQLLNSNSDGDEIESRQEQRTATLNVQPVGGTSQQSPSLYVNSRSLETVTPKI